MFRYYILTLLLVSSAASAQAEVRAREVNGQNGNALGERPYALDGRALGVGTKAQIGTHVQEYISAHKTIGALPSCWWWSAPTGQIPI